MCGVFSCGFPLTVQRLLVRFIGDSELGVDVIVCLSVLSHVMASSLGDVRDGHDRCKPKIDKVEKNQHMKASGMKRYDSWILDSLCAHHSDHKG